MVIAKQGLTPITLSEGLACVNTALHGQRTTSAKSAHRKAEQQSYHLAAANNLDSPAVQVIHHFAARDITPGMCNAMPGQEHAAGPGASPIAAYPDRGHVANTST